MRRSGNYKPSLRGSSIKAPLTGHSTDRSNPQLNKTKWYLLLILLTVSHQILANNLVVKDSLSSSHPIGDFNRDDASTRLFPGLAPAIQAQEFDLVKLKPIVDDSLLQQRDRAHSLRDDVEKAQRFRETLDASSVVDLPIGIVKSGGAIDYSIVIDRITLNPQGSILDAYVSFTIPQTGDRIAFGGLIPLSRDGGIVGTAKIYLLGDHYIELSESSLLTLVGSKSAGTFVEIDCNGFKGMSIEANIEFDKELLKPEDAKGKVIENKSLQINFQTYVQDWNELLVKISFPPFQVNGLEDVGFHIEDAYLDWSDLTNPQGLVFPVGYESAYLTSGNPNLWRGFFLKKAEVRLPNKLSEAGSGKRTAIGVENMVIDDTGFSGKIFAEYLIQAGDMNGWSFTLDRLKVGLMSNQVQEFELAGLISVPAFKKEGKDAQMGYRASRGTNGNYIFAVSIAEEVKLPLWAAEVSLYKGSSFIVSEKNDKFYPSASLNGMLSIRAFSKGPKAEISGVRFENLILSTEAPYFKPGTFGVGSADAGSKASGFPLVIKNIGIKSSATENKVGLSMDVTINIGGKPAEEGFSGTAGLIVWGDLSAPTPANTETGNTQSQGSTWEFEKVEITAVGISISKPGAYKLAGLIRFFDEDPVYGDGFNGSLEGSFKDKIAVKANAIFGKTPTYRYWFADALVTFKGGLALAPSFAAYSFGGGFYSKMKQASGGAGSILGTTSSGITYIPDENSMGLRAYMDFGSQPKEQAYNGDVTFEIAMNRHGGITKVSFIGNIYFLTPEFKVSNQLVKNGAMEVSEKKTKVLDKLTPRSQVYGNVSLLFDNENDVFHGDIEVYVNVVGGIVKGIGAGNKAGWAVLHFASDEWYVLIGTPEQPIGLEVARMFRASSYFMMGKNLPGSPPPPSKVSEILGGVNLDYMRDMNVLQSGLGLAFGMGFSVDTGDLRFLIFYGRFAAGAGFDIMLKDYGSGYHCEGSNDPFGINGWYANGQAYAYVEGKIGIRVNLKFYKGDYDILAIGAAAVLQAKGPNPFWMKGMVGGYYRILGGLVKGSCRFEVTVGKECKPIGESNPLQDVSIIADISPVKGTDDVDVFSTPQVAFNIPIGEIFEITDIENKKRSFRARLEELSARDGGNLQEATQKWNVTRDAVVLDTRDILPPQKEIKVLAKVVFEEKVNGSWQVVRYDGKAVEEVAETNFTTGTAPDYVPHSNVEFSYPIIGQYNFYINEMRDGFIRLRKGQPYLFEKNREWTQKGRIFSLNKEDSVEFNFVYDPGSKSINYILPGSLTTSSINQFELVSIPRQSAAVDENIRKKSTQLEGAEEQVEITTKEIEGETLTSGIKAVFDMQFRTSMYSTFSEKMASLPLSNSYVQVISPGFYVLGRSFSDKEYFDRDEIGANGKESLIKAEVSLDNSWYRTVASPLIYANYPLGGFIRISHRDPIQLGVPPASAAYVSQYAVPDFNNQSFSLRTGAASFKNNFYEIAKRDFLDVQGAAARYYSTYPNSSPEAIINIVPASMPDLLKENYKVKWLYVIPGVDKPLSEFETTFTRP